MRLGIFPNRDRGGRLAQAAAIWSASLTSREEAVMITKRRDSVATLHHNRESGHHTNAILEVQRLRSHQLIDLSRGTQRSHAVRVRADR